MASSTETALQALVSGLATALAVAGFPAPTRNETLDTLLDTIADGTGVVINVIDGNGDPGESVETLGADIGADGFEIVHRAEIEFLVTNADSTKREADFDLGLVTIDDAIKSSTGGNPIHTLGGAVSDARLIALDRSNPRTDGLPNIKYALLTVQLTFTSSRIF